jgi:phosphoribosylglycinamide formyltransferase 1
VASLRLAVLASGRGTDLQSLLDASQAGRIQSRVAVVVTDHAEAKALERARAVGLPAESLVPDPRLKGPDRRRTHENQIEKVLAHYKADLVVLAGYMRLLGPEFVARRRHRIVNIHPALLPAFPGLHGQKQALDWGVRLAGCTTHFVDEQTDHGPIILQAAVPVRRDDTEETLSRRILEVEHQLLPRTVHLIEQGRVRVESRRALLDPDASWTTKYPTIPDVLYGEGY